MSLGREVGLGSGDIVLDGDPVPPKRGTVLNFWPMSIVVKQSPISATAELLFYHTMEGRSQPSHCSEDVQ